VAEDAGKVIGVDRDVTTGLGDFDGCIITRNGHAQPGSIEQALPVRISGWC
jgi:hypothetical protein